MKSKKPQVVRRATAFAPATVANVGVGFDILGFALNGLGETATVEIMPGNPTVVIDPIDGYPQLPTDPLQNTATVGLVQLIRDLKLPFGFKVTLKKTIPIGSGLGGSSTSAVAAIVAANSLLKKKLTNHQLISYALLGESVASGSRHADNIAPCVEGGLVFVEKAQVVSTIKIKTPAQLRCVLVLPKLTINTKDARKLLKDSVFLSAFVQQTSNLAGFILGCQSGDFDLICRSLNDTVIEPQRAHLISGFADFKASALAAGALGCSISGSGPAIFALANSQKAAERIEKAFQLTSQKYHIPIHATWISSIARKGAHVRGARK
jgi:homoserine kinase